MTIIAMNQTLSRRVAQAPAEARRRGAARSSVRLTTIEGAAMEGSAIIRGTVASAMQDLQLALSNDSKSRIVTGQNDTIAIERSYRATWVYFVCILLFPIGLLALFAQKRVDRGTVAVSDNGNGTVRLRMSGTFYKASHAAINGVIERGSTPQ